MGESPLGNVIPILMAKRPEVGQVKTRLAADGRFGPEEAAEIAWAMLRCTTQRLAGWGPFVLAVSPDGCGHDLLGELGLDPVAGGVTILDQGPGCLGERLDRVWQATAADRPVAFFGADAPDVPHEALATIEPSLARADVAAGPTPDGGYWTLAGAAYAPAMLRHIDWGSGSVYDQSRQRATDSGLRFTMLPSWPDVDRPEDVHALRERLASSDRSTPLDAGPLRLLADRLASLCPSTPPRGPTR